MMVKMVYMVGLYSVDIASEKIKVLISNRVGTSIRSAYNRIFAQTLMNRKKIVYF